MTDVIEFQEIVEEKKWTFRALSAKDVFPIANLISKIGVKEFAEIFSKEEFVEATKQGEEANLNAVGIMFIVQAAQVILGNLDKCENDIYRVLSSTSNLGVKEIQDLSMGEFVEMIVDFIKKDDFADFFKQVSSLLK